jgi:hypothetical protein
MGGFLDELQGGFAAGQVVSGIVNRYKKAQFDADYDSHYKAMSENPDYTPNVNAKTFNPKAYHAASMAKWNESLKSDEAKQAKMVTMKGEIDMARIQATAAQAQMEDDYGQKNWDGVLGAGELAYENLKDGRDVVFDDDDLGWRIINADGSESEPRRFESKQAMARAMQGMVGSMLSNPDSLEQAVFEGDKSMTDYNMRMMEEGKWFMDTDGNMGQVIDNLIDKKQGGKKRGPVYQYAGKEISKEQWDKRGFIPYEMGKTRADVQGKIATATATAAGKGIQPGAMEKSVNFIWKVMSEDGTRPFTRVDALKFYQGGKLMEAKMTVLSKWIQTYNLRPSERPRDAKKIKDRMNALQAMSETELNAWSVTIAEREAATAKKALEASKKKATKTKEAAPKKEKPATKGLGKKKRKLTPKQEKTKALVMKTMGERNLNSKEAIAWLKENYKK